ncbi:hypothetical protein [Coleofasciculus sp. FACHB-1120]|uniref:hypothetical protein n=1 Tax=Coleofasciculus sp. FACHB-1120 TaxID=2692783 RepID=UPI001A7E514C|nr:hypothetical protein [Coleofasciculus sp. FACHB-1120]
MQLQRFDLSAVIIRTTAIALLALIAGCSSDPYAESALEPNISSNRTATTAEVGLARHLKRIKAKFYGAYWCPFCTKQKELFPKEALGYINYIECDAGGQNPRPDLCTKAKIKSFPTWEIQGRRYSGLLSLEELAELSGYKGDRNFQNRI